jgi:hypothetical protein
VNVNVQTRCDGRRLQDDTDEASQPVVTPVTVLPVTSPLAAYDPAEDRRIAWLAQLCGGRTPDTPLVVRASSRERPSPTDAACVLREWDVVLQSPAPSSLSLAQDEGGE